MGIDIILLFLAGVTAGAVNAVAGGSSFITFPALLFAGLPPLAANATNYIALLPGNLMALPAYRRELAAMTGRIIAPLILAGAGGLGGAALLLALGNEVFRAFTPWLMLGATLIFAFAPVLRRALVRSGLSEHRGLAAAVLTVISVYGGYFGAGMGAIMLGVLSVLGIDDLNRANAMKNLLITALSVTAAVLYVFSGEVSWYHAAIMALGAGVGGFGGATIARQVPQRAVRNAIIVFSGGLSIWFLVNGV